MRPPVPELFELLGRGGIGETWTATDPAGAPLAVKRLSCPEATAPSHLLRRVAAVRGLATELPELFVPVRDAWADGPDIWVVSERDGGVSLRRLIRVTTLTPAQMVSVAVAMLSGAAALHRAGLCHGAIHAGNVHVGSDGHVRLGDAGLAPTSRQGVRGEDARLARADLAAIATTLRQAVGGDRLSRRGYRLPPAMLEVIDALESDDGPAAEAAHQALVDAAGDLAGREAAGAARRQLGAVAGSITGTDGVRAVPQQTAARSVPFAAPRHGAACPLQAQHRIFSLAVTIGVGVVTMLLVVTLLRYR